MYDASQNCVCILDYAIDSYLKNKTTRVALTHLMQIDKCQFESIKMFIDTAKVIPINSPNKKWHTNVFDHRKKKI